MRIAIVEDEKKEAELLEKLLCDYADKHGYTFFVTAFGEPLSFFEKFNSDYDIVFLDICMPGMTGMDAAKRLREMKSEVCIVFVTNMLQYAVEGYSVQASDFLVKPVNATAVGRVMDRITKSLERKGDVTITVRDSTSGRVCVLKMNEIYYVEISRHRLTWHTTHGEIADWGSMEAVRSKLSAKIFSRCHVSYLVNLQHVKETKKDTVVVGNEILPVSRSQKKSFYADLAAYLGEDR